MMKSNNKRGQIKWENNKKISWMMNNLKKKQMIFNNKDYDFMIKSTLNLIRK